MRALAELLTEEATNRPEFAHKLHSILNIEISDKKPTPRNEQPDSELPIDIFSEWKKKGEEEFRFWLRDRPVTTLRATIRIHDLDPSRRTSKWKDAEKLSTFIVEMLISRLSRGSAFIDQNKK